ncbi:hypothetical protein PBI_STROKESEAT_49 [Mycobacterium phage Strokeseat]|uniref:Helix-turn-helix DNA binding domain protein n=1 Tax=Mycobacterium phage Hlubikazi TaxID=2767559 RepID=A0A7G9UZZ8_9CAUD|nr:helix-turn-helix DNA binding domain protein [Mycobacterium phage Hlubikazi]QGJ91133.1 hypothetical protein PBI_STROKESEAT_49 [Mycobacterium phage Strokeseat]QNN99050.1 hypothetical protein PBI_MANDLOVU_49 [Mycobacterium phage Mandlovu]QNN99603.1 helix-turn-helix DNA binding domain protein [Mycobacterium phage Hlubikazi]
MTTVGSARKSVDDAHIGAVVRALRGELGMSQSDLIKVLHALGLMWHQTTLCRLESGERALRASEVVVLAGALSTTPSDLLGVDQDLAVTAKRVRLKIEREKLQALADSVHRLERELEELDR